MLSGRMKGFVAVEYRKVILTKLTILSLIVLNGFLLVYAMKNLIRPVSADYTAESKPAANVNTDMKKNMKQVILRWMGENSEMPEQILSNIYDTALESINPDLILAVCLVESNFNPYAKSNKGAIGLMGVRSNFWLDELKTRGLAQEKRDLYLIPNNIASGAYVLQHYISKDRDLEQALTDYVGGDPDYAGKVLQALGEIYRVRSISAKDNA